MVFDSHKNFAVSTVATAPSTPTTGTSLVVNAGDGALFPTPPFNATVWPAGANALKSNSEIVRVTATSGGTLDSFTITRTQEGSNSRSIITGDQIAANMTAKTMGDVEGPLYVSKKIGALTIIGHSYAAGATQADSGTSNVYQEGLTSRLMAILGVHEHNTLQLAIAGTPLNGYNSPFTGNPWGGWKGVLQFVLPSNSTPINAVSDVVRDDSITSVGGAAIIVHGINDISSFFSSSPELSSGVDSQQAAFNIYTGKQSYRTILSRLRSGVVYCSSITTGSISWSNGPYGQSVMTTGGTGWTDVLSINGNSGAGYRKTSTSGDTFTLTLPTNFTGGIVAVNLLGQGNNCGITTASMTSGQTTVPISINASTGYFPTAGTFVVQTLSEQMLVTGGQGTATWNVVRGVNSTVAAANNSGSVFFIGGGTPSTAVGGTLTDTHRINWSGTSSASSHAYTPIGGQGNSISNAFGVRCPITVRFSMTSEDAGRTIIGTFSKPISGDTTADVYFDSWQIESSEPPPIAITNVHDFEFAYNLGASPSYTQFIQPWNTMVSSVVSEFTDGWVRIADVDAVFRPRNGTTTAALTSGATTGIAWNANSTSITPTTGTLFTWGRFLGEMAITTAVSGTAPNWVLGLKRGALGTTALAHSAGDWFGPMENMHTDYVHLNNRGHAVYASVLSETFDAMPKPTVYQMGQVQGNWSQYSQNWSMGIVDNGYLYNGWGTTIATAGTAVNGRQVASPIWIPKTCVLTQIGTNHSTGGSPGTSVVRFGIYMPDPSHAKPGNLIQDFGTVVCTGAGSDSFGLGDTLTSGKNVYQVLRSGWYWISLAPQAAPANFGPTFRFLNNNVGSNTTNLMPATLLTVSANMYGYAQTGITGAFANWATYSDITTTTSAAGMPRMFVRLRAPNFS